MGPEYFNIVVRADRRLLDKKLKEFMQTHNYNPIILMSKETVDDLRYDGSIYYLKTEPPCYMGMYDGYIVFVDPSKKFGEVELR